MTDAKWHDLIASVGTRTPVKALTYQGKKWSTFSLPAVFKCSDAFEYVVKSPRIGLEQARAAVTEQIVSSLGIALEAPVAEVRIVELVPELLKMADSEIGYLGAGLAHGSKRIPNCSEREWLKHYDEDVNRSRFAALAVLYGWTAAADQQLIYHEIPPPYVYSVDHGFFFGSGPSWTESTLNAAPTATLYQLFVGPPCNLSVGELLPAIERLRTITMLDIATAVAQPRTEWGITDVERVAVAKFLSRRKTEILSGA